MTNPLINTNSPVPNPNGNGNLTVSEAILLAIRNGNTHEDAALFAGISPATLSVWIRRGLETLATTQQTDEQPTTHTDPYVNLAQQIARADALSRIGLLADWRNGARKDWRGAKELLERRYGGPWAAPKTGVELSGPGGGAVQLAGVVMSHDEAARLRAEVELRAVQQARALPVVEVEESDGE